MSETIVTVNGQRVGGVTNIRFSTAASLPSRAAMVRRDVERAVAEMSGDPTVFLEVVAVGHVRVHCWGHLFWDVSSAASRRLPLSIRVEPVDHFDPNPYRPTRGPLVCRKHDDRREHPELGSACLESGCATSR